MMMRGRERLDVDRFAHGHIPGVVGMKIIPRHLSEDHTTGIVPGAVVAYVNAAYAESRGQCSGIHLDALGVQAAHDVLVAGNNSICRGTGTDIIDAFKPNYMDESR